jgi:hypothetical protein
MMQLRLYGGLGQQRYLFNGSAQSCFKLLRPSRRVSKNGFLFQSICALGATDLSATIVGVDGVAAGFKPGASCSTRCAGLHFASSNE